MLEVFDRQDVLDLHKIVMERFPNNDPEGYDLILWGDLKTLVESTSKDEISAILKTFITRIENLIDHKVKVIRCECGTKFKNREMNQFCEMKGIMRQYSMARTPQQNGFAERRNRTLIEAARTMLANSNLPTTFWGEAINTACYVQNKVLVLKPHNKTLYELFYGRTPTLSFMRPFRCFITILNTTDHLGKFNGKVDVGFFIGYSLNSNAFRVFKNRTRIVEENLHIRSQDDGFQPSSDDGKKVDKDPRQESACKDQEKDNNMNNTNNVNAAGTNGVNVVGTNTNNELPFDPEMPALEDISTFNFSSDHEDDDEEADMNNLDTSIQVSPTPTIRIHKDGCQELFLYEKTKEGIYVCQPLGFKDHDFPDKVYKVEKALYGLHQAPKAWYETLSTYLIDNGFQRGKIDKTLFIRRHKDDILLVQVYIDDIIFGSTKKELYNAFEKMMHEKFQMSSMGELTFFLGLKVKQKQDGIFISQDKYVAEIIKKYSFSKVENASTPMETQNPLLKDEDGEEVDVHMYRSMISSLMYLTSSRPDIMDLKGQLKFGLWYPKGSPFDLVAYTDSDYAGASLDRKSTIGVYTSCIERFWTIVKAKTVNGEVQLQALVDGKKVIINESTVRRYLQLKDAEGVDCLPNAAIFEQITLMGYEKISEKLTFYKYIFESMVKNLDNANKFLMYQRFVQVFLNNQLEGMSNHNKIYVTPYHTKKIFRNMKRVAKGFSRRNTPLFLTMMVQAQDEIGVGLADPTDPHHTPTIIQPSTYQPQKTKQHRKPRIKVTKVPQPSEPTKHVVDKAVNEEMNDSLERAATTTTSLDAEQDRGNIFKTQSKATSNEQGVNTPRSGEDSLKVNELMELCTKLQQRVLDLETTKTTKALEIDSLKRRVKKLERRKRSRTHRLKRLYKVGLSARVESSEDEGLGEEDASKHRRIADIDANEDIYLVNVYNDEDMFVVNDLDYDEVIFKGIDVVEQAKEVVDDTTLAKALMEIKSEKPKAIKAMIQELKQGTTTTTPLIITAASSRPKAKGIVIHEQEQAPTPIAKIDADYVLAQRLQAKEQEELTDAEKAKLFMQFLEKKRKFFAAKRTKEKRNRPPTRCQQRTIMCTYLKHMDGWKLKSLKKKSFAKIQELFDKAMKKRARDELEQERSKKQKVEDDKESEELKKCLEIIPDDEMIKMLKKFDGEELEVLWRLVKARFEKVKLVDYMDSFLLHNLKTMFEHHVEDDVWKNQQGLVKVKNWKLYDSCGVYYVTMQNILYYLLFEKMYPLTNHTVHHMFNYMKLQVDYECEMAFKLLRLVKKQLKEGYVS
uniref:Retrotransposon protein, putative, unclassified n=1 Tax=Tanacetum cinerariifolium TaxID=118510 RepID=A0A6L2NGR0_TANCI|nr:retrotransposon protein, putative, unclassified [Tanacetum cinerariifolium]